MIRHAPPEHVVPPAVYLVIFAVLLALTAVTVAVAFYDLGALNVVVALAVAVTKATLVIL
jgi:cytochrome c oxidase subunit 4